MSEPKRQMPEIAAALGVGQTEKTQNVYSNLRLYIDIKYIISKDVVVRELKID